MHFQTALLSFALMSLSCLMFATGKVCEDHPGKNCAVYKTNKECWNANYKAWMKRYCPRTCEFCGTVNKCRDTYQGSCAELASYGACHEHKNWAKANCAKTCRLCDCKDWPYGCCEDRKTLADGPMKKGCAMKLCVDNIICDKFKKACDSSDSVMKDFLRENCPYTCRYCRAPSPAMACEGTNPTYGCCWNGERATGPNQCPPCEDLYPRPCRLWKDSCGKAEFYGVRHFLDSACPATCGQCTPESAG